MTKPRKPRPSFDVPPTSSTDATGWAYRTDAETLPAAAPSAPPSVLERIITTPVALGLFLVLAPFSWGRRRPQG